MENDSITILDDQKGEERLALESSSNGKNAELSKFDSSRTASASTMNKLKIDLRGINNNLTIVTDR